LATAPPMRAQQQADALALLAETALHHEIDPGAPGERYQVVVHVDAAVLADRRNPANPCWKKGATFPRKRRGVWPATRAGWSCGTTTRGAYSRSGPGPGRFRRRFDARCYIATGAVASRAVMHGSERVITYVTGRRAAQPRSATWCSCAAAITTRSMKRATRSLGDPTAPSPSTGRMAGRYRRCRRQARCPRIRFIRCTRNMPRWDFGSTRERRAPAGWASGSTSAGRSTCCIRGRRAPDVLAGASARHASSRRGTTHASGPHRSSSPASWPSPRLPLHRRDRARCACSGPAPCCLPTIR
jgi:hypothetical protein